MWVTTRQAAVRLELAGLSRRHAVKVLEAGLAGPGTRTAAAILWDSARVEQLVERPWRLWSEVDARTPRGLFVSRRGADLASPWPISPVTAVWMRVVSEQEGGFPFLATVCGFVVATRDVVGLRMLPDRRFELELGAPSEWSEDLDDVRFLAERGRSWQLRSWPGVPARVYLEG